MSETLLQAAVPNTAELCCVMAELNSNEIRDSSAKSNFHWKTIKCRLIINTHKDWVIACPIYNKSSSGLIHVITSFEFYKTQRLQTSLKAMNMTWSLPRLVTPDVYVNCLRFSINFALAPRWNKVGPCLISGRNFLSERGNVSALTVNLSLQKGNENNTETILKVCPKNVLLCLVNLVDLDIPREVIGHFIADPEGFIDVTSFAVHRVTVLPSMRKGKLMGIFKKIPSKSPFKDYGEIRRHWKNMYGYRLPETDEGIIYYEVYFAVPGSEHLLYPDICVRSQLIATPYPPYNGPTLVQNFVKDVYETMPTVCGKSLQISQSYHTDSLDAKFSGASAKPSAGNGEGLLEATTRLSFSQRTPPKNQLRKDTKCLMSSPTSGNPPDTRIQLDLNCTTKTANTMVNQNRDPNIESPPEKSAQSNATTAKSSPMLETENFHRPISSPCDLENSQIDDYEKKATGEPKPKKRRLRFDNNNSRVSKYFDTPVDQMTVQNDALKNLTMSQKLQYNRWFNSKTPKK